MDHDLELIIPILEILEIEVCNILYNPGNIGKHTFSMFSCPGNIVIFSKKTRAEISRRTHRSMSRDLSYETDSGPKTKTV